MEVAIRDWTPAEVMMILSPNSYNGRDMMKYTFLDLITKGVLAYEKLEKDGKPFANIIEGPLLHTYQPREHESVFLAPFKKGQHRVPLKLFIRILNQSVGGPYYFRQRYVKRAPRLTPYFKPSFWNIINVVALNEKGKALQQQLKIQVEAARSSLKNLSVQQRGNSTGSALLLDLGPNIILLAEWDALMRRKDLEEVAEELLQQLPDFFLEISDFYQDQIWDSLGDAWSAISDAVSDSGGGSSDGGSSDGGSGCGSSGCGSGCGGGGCGS